MLIVAFCFYKYFAKVFLKRATENLPVSNKSGA